MNAKLNRNLRTGQFSIKITMGEYELNLWDSIVEHCAKSLSNSELREVYKQCNNQLASMNPDDVPYTFKEMMRELNEAIINRKAFTVIGVKNEL